eukprot:gene6004-5291_t
MPNLERFLFNRLVDMVVPGVGVMMDMMEAAEVAKELVEMGEITHEAAETIKDVKQAQSAAARALTNMIAKRGLVKRCKGSYACSQRLKVVTLGGSCVCDVCWTNVKSKTPHLRCADCDYDLCAACSLEEDCGCDDDDSDDSSSDDDNLSYDSRGDSGNSDDSDDSDY